MRGAARVVSLFAAIILGFVVTAIGEEAQSGHTDWPPNGVSIWSFDWEVKDNAGLALRNVKFKNELVLYKASNPVARVKYVRDGPYVYWDLNWPFKHEWNCGPFADQIVWGPSFVIPFGSSHSDYGLQPVPECGNKKVCQKSFTVGDTNWLSISIYARIGAYHLFQAWYLSEDGQILPRMFSRGIACPFNHTHHVYWRLDFDINQAWSNRIFVWNHVGGLEITLYKVTNESNDLKNPSTARRWFVQDSQTGHGAWVVPGPSDGSLDAWSFLDVAARRYHCSEDGPWPFGLGELGYDNGEGIQEKDVVFWYVSHVFHDVTSQDSWHESGPTIIVHR